MESHAKNNQEKPTLKANRRTKDIAIYVGIEGLELWRRLLREEIERIEAEKQNFNKGFPPHPLSKL